MKWIGYDQSPYVIAKTMVLIEMMKNKTISVHSVAQVWYSAAWWSYRTQKDFRKSLAKVWLSATSNASPSVQEYLIHWQHHDVSLQESRQGWLRDHDCTWSDQICNWK